jgi:hypothetical protein
MTSGANSSNSQASPTEVATSMDRTDSSSERLGPSLWFGVALIVVAVFFIYFSIDIKRLGLLDDNDPGPRAFPVVLSLTLLVGGLVQVIGSAIQYWRGGVADYDGEPETEILTAGRRDALVVGVMFLAYLFAVPRLGFYLPTALFAWLMTWKLGAKWWSAVVTVVVLLVVIRVLFVGLFRVQLPQGVLGAMV